MKRIGALLATGATLIAAAPALATSVRIPLTGNVASHDLRIHELRTMVATARRFWGHDPACQEITFLTTTRASAGTQSDSLAYVLPTDVASCTVRLVGQWRWNSGSIAIDYPLACRFIVHEYAHLLGFWDIDQTGTILSHVITTALPLPACDNARFVTGSRVEGYSTVTWRNGKLTIR